MKAEQHTHDLKIQRRYPNIDKGAMQVKYGDQIRRWPMYGPFLEKRRQAVIREMVEHHDRQSIKAGERAAAKQAGRQNARQMTEDYGALVKEHAGRAWEEKS